jgi:hypothetical protein
MVNNPSGPPTFMRKGRLNNNAFQISFAWNEKGKPLSKDIPVEMLARDLVEKQLKGKPLQEFAGDCRYGNFVSVVFSAETFSHCQVWCVTNGIHLIFATFICETPPTPSELNEVEEMALSLHFKESAGKDYTPRPKRLWWS